MHRCSGLRFSSLLFSFQRRGARPSSPEISWIFFNRQRPDTRLLSVVVSSMEMYGGSGLATGGVVGAVAGQMAAGVWLKTVQELSSACDRAARSCALRELRADRTRVMENPSASGTAGLRDSAARSGIGVDRPEAVQDPTSRATRAPTFRADRGSGWPGQGDAESFRPERDRDTGLDRADRGSRCSGQGDAGFFRTARDRATGRESARAQLAPDPQGVCSLLGRAGEARSGFCREVKRRHA